MTAATLTTIAYEKTGTLVYRIHVWQAMSERVCEYVRERERERMTIC